MRFPRPALAQSIARILQGRDFLSDATSGLFFAAPRRTGKSTFLQEDLVPQLEQDGAVVVYVDLWADQREDPAVLIARRIGQALAKHQNIVRRAADVLGLNKVTISGVEIEISQIGAESGATLADALIELHRVSGQPVALIIDEAQHVLRAERGNQVMAALKSARDQMNAPGRVALMLVMSGSDRDKLLRLTNTRGAAFYGSEVRPMPLLDADYVRYLAGLVAATYPQLAPFDNEKLIQAFEIFGHRPQLMLRAMEKAVSPFESSDLRFDDRVVEFARRYAEEIKEGYLSTYQSLTQTQRAIITELLRRREAFRPFDATSRASYEAFLGRAIDNSLIQSALESLRDMEPPLIWKSVRGEYALEDTGMQHWFNGLNARDAWPPADEENPPAN